MLSQLPSCATCILAINVVGWLLASLPPPTNSIPCTDKTLSRLSDSTVCCLQTEMRGYWPLQPNTDGSRVIFTIRDFCYFKKRHILRVYYTKHNISLYKSESVCVSVCLHYCSLCRATFFSGSWPNLVYVHSYTANMVTGRKFISKLHFRRT